MLLALLLAMLCCNDMAAQRKQGQIGKRGKPWYAHSRNTHISWRARGWNKKGKNDNEHYFATSLSGGYSLFVNGSKDVVLKGFVGSAATVGYEFRKPSKHVWFSMAAECQMLTSSIGLSYPIFDRWINDSEGRLAMYHYDMIESKDRQNTWSVSVPIMIGYFTKGFYVGAGPKLGYFFDGHAKNDLDYKTHATYDRYIDEYEDMPNHYYTYNSVNSGREKMKFSSISFALCVEAGYEVMHKEDSRKIYWKNKYRRFDFIYRLKLGLYAEYGFLDINGNAASGTVNTYDATNPFRLIVKPFYTTESPSDRALRPFYAGVKLTFMVTAICDRCRGRAKVF